MAMGTIKGWNDQGRWPAGQWTVVSPWGLVNAANCLDSPADQQQEWDEGAKAHLRATVDHASRVIKQHPPTSSS